MNISKLKQSPKTFTRIFGIAPQKFDALVLHIEPLWRKAEAKRLRHPRKIKKGSGRPYVLSLEESVAMLLLYTRSYTTHVFLSALFAGILPSCVPLLSPYLIFQLRKQICGKMKS